MGGFGKASRAGSTYVQVNLHANINQEGNVTAVYDMNEWEQIDCCRSRVGQTFC